MAEPQPPRLVVTPGPDAEKAERPSWLPPDGAAPASASPLGGMARWNAARMVRLDRATGCVVAGCMDSTAGGFVVWDPDPAAPGVRAPGGGAGAAGGAGGGGDDDEEEEEDGAVSPAAAVAGHHPTAKDGEKGLPICRSRTAALKQRRGLSEGARAWEMEVPYGRMLRVGGIRSVRGVDFVDAALLDGKRLEASPDGEACYLPRGTEELATTRDDVTNALGSRSRAGGKEGVVADEGDEGEEDAGAGDDEGVRAGIVCSAAHMYVLAVENMRHRMVLFELRLNDEDWSQSVARRVAHYSGPDNGNGETGLYYPQSVATTVLDKGTTPAMVISDGEPCRFCIRELPSGKHIDEVKTARGWGDDITCSRGVSGAPYFAGASGDERITVYRMGAEDEEGRGREPYSRHRIDDATEDGHVIICRGEEFEVWTGTMADYAHKRSLHIASFRLPGAQAACADDQRGRLIIRTSQDSQQRLFCFGAGRARVKAARA